MKKNGSVKVLFLKKIAIRQKPRDNSLNVLKNMRFREL